MKMHIAVFSYALCVAAWQVASSAETSKQVPKQRSLPMCASGLRPWMESGTKAQSCGRPTDQPCPSGYVCEPQANVCCPAPADDKSTTAGGTLPTAPTRPDGKGQKQSCSADNDCLPPSICKDSGYCCLLRLDQEPPPVGCPFGTRPLKNAQGQEVSCSPSQAGSCPGDTMCYQDSLTGSYHCCGKDPGEGCPSGSRAVKAGGKVVTCTPGSATQSCQGKALCQWSYIIDRYQCCEADNVEEQTIKIKTTTIQIKTTTPENSEAGVTETEKRKRVAKNGCPTGFAPLLSAPSGSAQACRPDGSQSCPANYGCEFNFWSAAYQCCGRDLGQCASSGQVPYLEPQSGSARQCNVGAVNQCPAGYTCSQTTTGQFMCCGTAGRCPAQFTTVLDLQGRPQACRQGAPSGSISGCKSPATCQSAVGGVVGQYLCCSSNTGGGSVQCAIGGHSPYPSAATPQYCNMNVPNCAAGSVCEPSNIAGTYVCCKPSGGTGQNACPNGWTLTNGVQTFCNPASASCAARGTCLASTLVPNQFVCCTPGGTGVTQYSCPQGTPVSGTAGGNQFCSGIGGSCPVATGSLATCQQAVNAPGTYICCYAQQSQNYICPNSGSPYMMGGNQYQYCTPTAPNCNAPYTCQQSVNVPSVSICCTGGSSTTNLHCQGNGTPALTGNNQNVVCNVNVANMCPQGATCQSSLESTAVSICCYGNQPSNLRCPDGSQPSTLGTQPQTCTPFGANSCSNGYTCQQAMGVAGTYVCCRSATTPTDYTCPAGFQPYRAPGSSALTFCNRQNPTNCVGGTTCLQATNAPQYSICCSSSTGSSLCPAGQQALLGANQQPVFCNSPADYCSSVGYMHK